MIGTIQFHRVLSIAVGQSTADTLDCGERYQVRELTIYTRDGSIRINLFGVEADSVELELVGKEENPGREHGS